MNQCVWNMEIKEFKKYIIIDYRTGDMRVVKKPKKLGPFDLGCYLNIKVNLPAKQEIKFDAEITLSENKIREISSELV